MSVQKNVEAEPYHFTPGQGEIWDARVVLPNLTPMAPAEEFQFASEPIPIETMKEHHDLRRCTGFVNGLTQLEFAGHDGEESSGFVELVHVAQPAGESQAIMRALCFYHDTQLPVNDCSWMLEFNDVDVAKAFWNHSGPYFPLAATK